jgi:nucleoside-diphosphate-sugar epimerase
MASVIVTGGCGFIGSFVVKRLLERKYQVVIIDNRIIGSRSIIPDSGSIRIINADITDLDERCLQDCFNAYWIHLAALPYIPDSFERPAHFFVTNTIGTMNACELAIKTNAKRFVFISSSEVYKSGHKGEKLKENSPLDPLSPYANSKLAAEVIVKRYLQQGLPSVILRLFNSYGPNATHPYFIPAMIMQWLTQKEIKVGNLNSSRDFTYVTDTAEAIVLAMDKVAIEGEVINIGSGEERSMMEILEEIRLMTNSNNKKIVIDENRKRPIGRDPECLVTNQEKAKAKLNWRPLISFEEGLKTTIQWVRELKDNFISINN